MKKETAKQSPRISRSFPEWRLWPLTFSIVLALIMGALGVRYIGINTELQKIVEEREKIAHEINFWKNITSKYPDYRDAYFKIALLEYRLGDIESAKENVQKTLRLDPNFEKGRELQEVLE